LRTFRKSQNSRDRGGVSGFAHAQIAFIDAHFGGFRGDIEQGFQVREIGDAAYQHGQEVESGDRTIVGVNRFTTEEPPIEGLMRVNEGAARTQIERLEKLRKERDDSKVKAAWCPSSARKSSTCRAWGTACSSPADPSAPATTLPSGSLAKSWVCRSPKASVDGLDAVGVPEVGGPHPCTVPPVDQAWHPGRRRVRLDHHLDGIGVVPGAEAGATARQHPATTTDHVSGVGRIV
jgi:hypothetical protein